MAFHFSGLSEMTGAHLENLVLTDLTAWCGSRSQRPVVHHWRTASQTEVDFVVELPSGRLLPIKVKAATAPTSRDAAGLRAFLDSLATHPSDAIDIGGAQSGLTLVYLYTSSCKFCFQQREHIARLLSDSTLPPRYAMTPEGSADAVHAYWEGTPLAARARFRLAPSMSNTLAKVESVPTLLVVSDSGSIVRAAAGVVLRWSQDALHAWIRGSSP